MVPVILITRRFHTQHSRTPAAFKLKFSIRYLLTVIALLSSGLAILASFGPQTLIIVVVLAWPALMAFAIEPKTMNNESKIRAVTASSGITLVVSVAIIMTQSSSPFAILIALFSVVTTLASWFPQFLAIMRRYDAVEK